MNPPTTNESELELWPLSTKWIQVPSNLDLASVAAQSIFEMPALNIDGTLPFTDVILLTQTHSLGERIVKLVEHRGLKVHHIFSEDPQEQRLRKIAFFLRDHRVKASTVKSFKGWEARALVIVIENAEDQEHLAEAYVALTRLKRATTGSYLTIVCGASELEEFGSTWPFIEYNC